MVIALLFALKSYSTTPNPSIPDEEPPSKKILLVFMCVMFGVEIGYKICSRRLLYILYPCHIMTIVQVSL